MQRKLHSICGGSCTPYVVEVTQDMGWNLRILFGGSYSEFDCTCKYQLERSLAKENINIILLSVQCVLCTVSMLLYAGFPMHIRLQDRILRACYKLGCK